MRRKREMQKTLETPTFKLLPYIPILFTFFICYHSHLTQAQVFIYATCSQERYQPNTQYGTNLNSLLSSIVSTSSQTLYDSFVLGNDSSAPQDSAVYGLYQCRGDLRTRDCSTCIASLIDRIELACPYAYGASLQLDRCLVRYEHANFLGIADTSLRYKRCSNSLTSDYEVLRRRDDVLTDLQGAAGFGVSATGQVDGYAQCLGDLSGSDCTDCLSEAVTQVKSSCGSAAAGDVYLAQCYVRYWVTGHYDAPSDSANHDDGVGKAVAIIIGAIAGVAILVVLLSLCKNSVVKK